MIPFVGRTITFLLVSGVRRDVLSVEGIELKSIDFH